MEYTHLRNLFKVEFLKDLYFGPLICLLYSDPISETIKFHNMNHHMYADNTQLYFAFKSTNPGGPACYILLVGTLQFLYTLTRNHDSSADFTSCSLGSHVSIQFQFVIYVKLSC